MLYILFVISLIFCSCTSDDSLEVTKSNYDLDFPDLAVNWDEAMPLGNGVLGALVWEKDNKLRFALDRVDLWDLRPLEEFKGDQYTFKWVYDHVQRKDYKPVLDWYNISGKGYAWPTKLPGAAIEFDTQSLGKLKSNHLYEKQAVSIVEWEDGTKIISFVHAEEPLGWFVIENASRDIPFTIIPPSYDQEKEIARNDYNSQSISRLGYVKGCVKCDKNKISYRQDCWGNSYYEVVVKWKKENSRLIGVWSITNSDSKVDAETLVDTALDKGVKFYYQSHVDWWNNFYNQSYIDIPDSVILKQYYNEIYKMGCVARENSYPISLQAVWTADNGEIAPWKGDYHHDLNTELSYWPYYTSNHLKEALGYLHTLWNQRENNRKYTKKYFGVDGINVPGVATLTGEPMGGWIQYSLGPTISAWLSHHFYLQWKYSQDRDFLSSMAYPYLKEVSTFLEQFTIVENGVRKLPLSTSPEHNDNRLDAWFVEMSNFDRALIRFVFSASAELALELGLKKEAEHWNTLLGELPWFDVDSQTGLTVAPNHIYKASHRHFSHLLAIYPLGLLDVSNSSAEADLIKRSIKNLEDCGSDWWCGFSFSWLASLKARALDGEGASRALHDFAENFCLRNTFHANGDQKNSGKSKFTYRPFTLEGNMAFAAGVQEMLLQSHTGIISIFPAIPSSWKNASFTTLRAMGAFLVSATLVNGNVEKVECIAERGGLLRLKNPFTKEFSSNITSNRIKKNGDILEIHTEVGERICLMMQ